MIVSDDLEMKAIASSYTPAEAAVTAIAAGCDAVLMCGVAVTRTSSSRAGPRSADSRSGRRDHPMKRIETALERNRQAKQRFLREWRPPNAARLKALIGLDSHRAISELMATFA